VITLKISCILFCALFFMESFNAHADVMDDAISPVTEGQARAVLIIGSSVTLLAAAFKSSFVKSTQYELQQHKPLCCIVTKWGNSFLQIFPNAIYSIGFGLHYWMTDDQDSRRRSLNMAKSTIYAGLFTDILKPIVRETRPNGGKESFPSGHTTTAFAFASYIGMEHEWYYAAPAYMVASFVGFCRMHDNYHYLHDVLAGATIGMSYGIAMGLRGKEEKKDSAIVLLPTDDLSGASLKWVKNF